MRRFATCSGSCLCRKSRQKIAGTTGPVSVFQVFRFPNCMSYLYSFGMKKECWVPGPRYCLESSCQANSPESLCNARESCKNGGILPFQVALGDSAYPLNHSSPSMLYRMSSDSEQNVFFTWTTPQKYCPEQCPGSGKN